MTPLINVIHGLVDIISISVSNDCCYFIGKLPFEDQISGLSSKIFSSVADFDAPS
jgi:hypothetical protein